MNTQKMIIKYKIKSNHTNFKELKSSINFLFSKLATTLHDFTFSAVSHSKFDRLELYLNRVMWTTHEQRTSFYFIFFVAFCDCSRTSIHRKLLQFASFSSPTIFSHWPFSIYSEMFIAIAKSSIKSLKLMLP